MRCSSVIALTRMLCTAPAAMAANVKTVVLALFVFLAGVGVGAPSAASAHTPGWTRQFGTTDADEALGVGLDGAGNAYVVGWAFGALPGQDPAGTVDAFVRKYDPAGQEIWTRQFGSWERDFARAVAVDGAGNAYVVGETWGTLPGQASGGGYDAFVRKYNPSGDEVWTRQFGGGGGEAAWGVATDPTGDAYVVGTTPAALPGQTSSGGFDAFVVKFDPAGEDVWTRQFGGEGGEGARAVALDPRENVLVVGSTDWALPGERPAGGFDAYLRRYSPQGNELWTRQFGSPADDYGMAVAVDGSGHALVAGSADEALPGQRWAGGTDAFLRSFDDAGGALWTKQFGSDTSDQAWGLAIDTTGSAYLVGSTQRYLPGQRPAGGSDAFVRQYDASGAEVSTRQFGTAEMDLAYGVAVGSAGLRVVGTTRGTLPGQTSAGDRDAFVMQMN